MSFQCMPPFQRMALMHTAACALWGGRERGVILTSTTAALISVRMELPVL